MVPSSPTSVADSVAVGVFAPAYPPAYRGGGPIRSLEAMVSETPIGFTAYVLTSDRDFGAAEPLPVPSNRWLAGEYGAIYYASLNSIGHLLRALWRLRTLRPPLLYFNSFFNRPLTMLPLLLWRLGFWGSPTVLLAPRGEFSPGPLARHAGRKKMWITLFRLLRIHRSTVWHATAEHEAQDIRRMWGEDAPLVVRENDTLLPKDALKPAGPTQDPLRLVFLGRLTELKGAAIVLDALQGCKANVSLDVYGPHEDLAYFETCQALASTVPPNVTVRFHDGVDHDQVQKTLNQYELFVYPTAGENFGHVFIEALSSSCVVATTPTTPWTTLLNDGGGIVVPDRTTQAWRVAIESFAQHSPEVRLSLRRRAGAKYTEWASQPAKPHLWQLAIELVGSDRQTR